MSKRVTIRDIAEAAGVCSGCVSWVLRNHPRSKNMNAKTRQRILDAASKLGYVQNQLASATRTGQVNTIAVILTFLEGNDTSMINQIIQGILMETSVRKFNIKVFTDTDLESSFRSIAENRIEKVISTSVLHEIREKTAELAKRYGLNLVFCYEHGHGGFPALNTDNAEITAKAVHYLAEKGHTRIAMLCAPHRFHFVKDRHAGYLRGMAECALDADPRRIACSLDIERSVRNMLALPEEERPTAFITLDDFAAAKAQRAVWKCGLRIPEDCSMIGIGDTVSSRAAVVPITTFRESFVDMGKLLVRLVLGEPLKITPDADNVYHLHAELIVRESVYDIKTKTIGGNS